VKEAFEKSFELLKVKKNHIFRFFAIL